MGESLAPSCSICGHTSDYHHAGSEPRRCMGYDLASPGGPPVRLCGCPAYAEGPTPQYPPFICPVCGTRTDSPGDVQEKFCVVCDGWTGDRVWRMVHWEMGADWQR